MATTHALVQSVTAREIKAVVAQSNRVFPANHSLDLDVFTLGVLCVLGSGRCEGFLAHTHRRIIMTPSASQPSENYSLRPSVGHQALSGNYRPIKRFPSSAVCAFHCVDAVVCMQNKTNTQLTCCIAFSAAGYSGPGLLVSTYKQLKGKFGPF